MFDIIKDLVLPHIFEIITAILSLIVAYYVIPCIKSVLIPWLKEKRLYNTVQKFVQAAEKLAESGVIEKCDKKSMVIQLLTDNGVLVDGTVEAFIESCVKELDIITSSFREEIVETDGN